MRLAVVLLVLMLPASARAATRYASPDGLGDCTTADRACALETAFNGAASGDTISVAGGTYGESTDASIDLSGNGRTLTVAGAVVGRDRPQLDQYTLSLDAGSAVRDLTITPGGPSGYGLQMLHGMVERVFVSASGGADACQVLGTIRDSVCAHDFSADGLQAVHDTQARNVTGTGRRGFALYAGFEHIEATNAAGVGIDLDVYSGANSADLLTLDHSAYDTAKTYGPFTESARVAPIVTRSATDLRQAPASPTIDAGTDDGVLPGELDLNGNLRTLGARTDVGAYEHVPAAPDFAPADPTVSPTDAVARAGLDGAGGLTRWHVEYGKTDGYGSATDEQTAAASLTRAPVAASLPGLSPNTTYHYRFVGESDGGITTGADRTFTTGPNTRYVAPGATGDACTQVAPCALFDGFSGAASGDTIVVGSGTYEGGLKKVESDGRSLTIQGAVVGRARPVLNDVRFKLDAHSSIRDLSLHATDGNPLYLLGDAVGERLEVAGPGTYSCLIYESAVLLDSACRATGVNIGLLAASPGARNISAVGNQPLVLAFDGATVLNGAFTSTSDQPDARSQDGAHTIDHAAAQTFGNGVTATHRVDRLLSRSAADLRPLPGSPTIDAGLDSASPLDLNGNLRTIGTHTDVGAYEFVPAAPDFGALDAIDVTKTTATVRAGLENSGGRTYWHLELGSTSTPEVVAPGSLTRDTVAVPLTGLKEGTTYHYRFVGESDGGTTTGPDRTFTTAADPVPSPSPVPAPSPTETPMPAKPTLSITAGGGSRRAGQLLLNRRTITLFVRCGDAACTATASGYVTIGKRRFGTLGAPRQPLALGAHTEGQVKLRSSLKLRRAVRHHLRRHRKARAVIHLRGVFVDSAGTTITKRLSVKVRRLKR